MIAPVGGSPIPAEDLNAEDARNARLSWWPLGAPIIQSDNSASSILPASCVQYAGEYCARADARYCSKACKKAALRARKGDKNDDALSDTWQADLSPFSVQETQQNWGSKSRQRGPMRGTVPGRAKEPPTERGAQKKTTASHQTLAPPKMSGIAFKKPNKIGG